MTNADLFQLVITTIVLAIGVPVLVWVIRNKSVLAENAKLAHNNRIAAERNAESARRLAEELRQRAA